MADPRDMDLKPELDRAMGRSPTKQGDSKSQRTQPHEEIPSRDTSDKDSNTHDHNSPMSFTEHLKGFLGIGGKEVPAMGEKNPNNAAAMAEAGMGDAVKAVSQGVAQAPGNTADYGG